MSELPETTLDELARTRAERDDLHAKLQEAEKRAETAERELERISFVNTEALEAVKEQARAEGYERGKAER